MSKEQVELSRILTPDKPSHQATEEEWEAMQRESARRLNAIAQQHVDAFRACESETEMVSRLNEAMHDLTGPSSARCLLVLAEWMMLYVKRTKDG